MNEGGHLNGKRPYRLKSAINIIAFVVPSTEGEYHYSIPLDKKDTIADLTNRIHLISRLDDENFFGLYPAEILSVLRENWHRYHEFRERRIPETESAMRYAGQTLVLLYINK